MPVKILQKESPVLREVAREVPVNSIKSSKIKAILKEMKTALDSQEDGVAIAAPQIGYPLRIFVVSGKVQEMIAESKRKKIVPLEIKNGKSMPSKGAKDLIFINPILKKISKERKTVEEGCLSVRYLYGQVSRSTKATVVAFDENGNKFERGGTGLLAQIFQHEIDHLEGILFVDKAQNVEEIFPEHLKSNLRINSKKIKR